MLKTIDIGDKQIVLQSSAATPIIYKAQFHNDFFSDLVKMAGTFDSLGSSEDVKVSDLDPDKIDMGVIYNIVWALAKNANHDIGEPITYFAQFEEMPLKEVGAAISELTQRMFKTAKKSTALTSLTNK